MRVFRQFWLRHFRLDGFGATEAGGAAEDDEIDQRIRAQAIGAVHRNAGGFTDRHQARHDMIRIAVFLGQNLAVIVRRDAAHVVMHGRKHRDRLTAQIDAREDLGAFGDARQALGQNLRIEVIKVQEDVIGFRAVATAFANFDRHRARDDVARCEILGMRGVTLHEALAL